MDSLIECRNVAVGCAGRMAACAGFMRRNVGDVAARPSLLACALVVVELGALADSISKQRPELKLEEAEWNSVESMRAGQSSIALSQTPRVRVMLDIGVVEDRLLSAQARAPELGGPIKVVLGALEAFMAVVKGNIPD